MKTCKICNTQNRDIAKYCKKCGKLIVEENPFGELYAKESILNVLASFKRRCESRAKRGGDAGLDSIIYGDAGTGKMFVAQLLHKLALQAGVVTSALKVVDASEIDEFNKAMEKNLTDNKGGVILFTNVHKLLPDGRSKKTTALDKLFNVQKRRTDMPVIFLSGATNEMKSFIDNNQEIISNFEFIFPLENFDDNSLSEYACSLLTEKYNITITPEAIEKLHGYYRYICRNRGAYFSNAKMVKNQVDVFVDNMVDRDGSVLEPQDIQGPIYEPKTEDEILAELDSYVGLQSVKDEIRKVVRTVKAKKESGVKGKLIKDHFLFTGNPGTGKTTFARKLGDVLNAIGALPSGQFVEVAAKDLIGRYVGATEEIVKDYVSKAIGGVLFIDEAYTLKGDTGYGADAVNTLLTLLENRKGEFVCIMAGYTKEMGEFVRMNPGIPSRCNVTIEFPDYNARELEQLFRMKLIHNDDSKFYTLDAKAESMLPKVFDKMYLKRTDTFGNAREVRNLFDLALKRHNDRLVSDTVLTYEDIVGAEGSQNVSVDDVMKELDCFVGMRSVKYAVHRIAKEIAIQKQLIEMGEAAEGLTKFNFILTGNPGTGKSSVARLFGKIFKALDVTATDRVVEKVPKDIISKYANESDKNMDAAINEAMGGVLFLDEAYDLEPMDSAGKSTSSEGKKAIQTLMTRMENEAGKFVVVCAGYPKEMANFLNSNPGLKRRFSHTIHIDDYTAEEMLEIFERGAKASKYNFHFADDIARMKALSMFRNMVARKDDKFGNAGEVMKKLAETKTNINNRIANIPLEQWTPEILHSAYAEDIPFKEAEKVTIDQCLSELNELIGLDGVKSSLTKLAHTINNEIESAKAESRLPEVSLGHYLFLGNPGTGKTTVARLMGKILYSMGALPTPNVVEVGKAQLVGRYVGDTEAITSHLVDSAMGGILFIDEAYQLAFDQFGRSALETLVARLENNRGKFVCIAAGYSQEMQEFLAENSGFESRFPKQNRITFEDYIPDELFDIFLLYARKGGYTLDSEATEALRNKLTTMYLQRTRTFGNGRDVRNLFDEVKSNIAMRLAEDGKTHTASERKLIKKEDIL